MAGESLGVMFDNLREKEAFIKLLQGDLPLVQGRVYVDEQLAADPRALRGAIHMVAGCSALARGLSIAENVYYKQLPGCFFSTDIYEEMLQDLMERFQVDVNVRAPLDGRTHAESVAIELMKACTSGRKIVVLADMTGYLSHDELTRILDVADRMRGAGYAFIIIESCWEPVFGRAGQHRADPSGAYAILLQAGGTDPRAEARAFMECAGRPRSRLPRTP
jgi:ABC-type sugar transport system ATPase subunit